LIPDPPLNIYEASRPIGWTALNALDRHNGQTDRWRCDRKD